MTKTVDVLCGDHRTFSRLLDQIEREIEVFRSAGQPDYALLEAVLEYLEGYRRCAHIPVENLLYDKLRLRAPDLCGKIPDLGFEHNRQEEDLSAFAQLLRRVLAEGEIPRETVVVAEQSFVHGMRRHMEMEEVHFFPAALENLKADDWRETEARLAEGPDGAQNAGHYENLLEEILTWGAERAAH